MKKLYVGFDMDLEHDSVTAVYELRLLVEVARRTQEMADETSRMYDEQVSIVRGYYPELVVEGGHLDNRTEEEGALEEFRPCKLVYIGEHTSEELQGLVDEMQHVRVSLAHISAYGCKSDADGVTLDVVPKHGSWDYNVWVNLEEIITYAKNKGFNTEGL